MTGDPLAIWLFLLAAMIAAAIGALSVPSGKVRNSLWGFAALSAFAAFSWWHWSAASPIVRVVQPFVSALVQSGALVMVVTITVVSMMVRGQRPKSNPGTVEVLQRDQDQKVIRALEDARNYAHTALSLRTQRDAEMALPEMKAALLSANKHFKIPMLPLGLGAKLDIEAGMRLIEKINPLLDGGHIDEARTEAQAFIGLHKAQK